MLLRPKESQGRKRSLFIHYTLFKTLIHTIVCFLNYYNIKKNLCSTPHIKAKEPILTMEIYLVVKQPPINAFYLLSNNR